MNSIVRYGVIQVRNGLWIRSGHTKDVQTRYVLRRAVHTGYLLYGETKWSTGTRINVFTSPDGPGLR